MVQDRGRATCCLRSSSRISSGVRSSMFLSSRESGVGSREGDGVRGISSRSWRASIFALATVWEG